MVQLPAILCAVWKALQVTQNKVHFPLHCHKEKNNNDKTAEELGIRRMPGETQSVPGHCGFIRLGIQSLANLKLE